MLASLAPSLFEVALRFARAPFAKKKSVVKHSLLSAHRPLPTTLYPQQAGRDLNPQPLVLETSALPIELPTYAEPRVTEGT